MGCLLGVNLGSTWRPRRLQDAPETKKKVRKKDEKSSWREDVADLAARVVFLVLPVTVAFNGVIGGLGGGERLFDATDIES